MNSYEQKQEARRERLQAAAKRATGEAPAVWERAGNMAAVIPMGQPILVGHHSERRDRNYRARIDATERRAADAGKRAHELEHAAAAVGSAGVSSDDPDAVAKLRAELSKLEDCQAKWKQINGYVRRGDRVGLAAMPGMPASLVAELFEPDCSGRTGVPSYKFTNNSSNMRRIKARIAQLTATSAEPERAPIEGSGYRIVEDRDINRVCIEFPSKPSDAVRAELKSSGFRWSPNRGAWVRQLSNGAWYAAEQVERFIVAAGLPDRCPGCNTPVPDGECCKYCMAREEPECGIAPPADPPGAFHG